MLANNELTVLICLAGSDRRTVTSLADALEMSRFAIDRACRKLAGPGYAETERFNGRTYWTATTRGRVALGGIRRDILTALS